MWKADLERDEKALVGGRDDCTSAAWLPACLWELLGTGLFHGEAENKWELLGAVQGEAWCGQD